MSKKNLVIIGSQAMKHHFPDFPRIPADCDVICTKETFSKVYRAARAFGTLKTIQGDGGWSNIIRYTDISYPVEYLFSDGQKSLELILDQFSDNEYAPIPVLYSIKKAHIHFSIKFDKHIQDFMFLRKKLREIKEISLEADLGSESDLLDSYPALTELHFKETEKRLGKLRTPKMNQSVEKFFGKSKKFVKSYYVHDNMHKAIAELHSGSPIYESILKEGKEVETDYELWKKLSIQEKIWCVLEEVYVIALERKIIPSLFQSDISLYTPKEAFDWALMRVCTTLCDGFFRDFAVRAYDQVQQQYNPNYVELFFKSIGKYEKPEESSD